MKNNLGETPLHQSSDAFNPKLAELLIEFGANINATQNDGDTPLHYAAFKNNAKVAEALISKHANIDAQNAVFGRTPLHYAINFDNIEVAKVLLRNGASHTIRDISGQTPLGLAGSSDIKKVI